MRLIVMMFCAAAPLNAIDWPIPPQDSMGYLKIERKTPDRKSVV